MGKKKDILDFTTELKYSLDIMHEQAKFAETKNASMIVFTSAIFIGVISNVEEIRNFIIVENNIFLPFNEFAFKLFIFLILFVLAGSFIFSIRSFFPQINQKSIERYDRNNQMQRNGVRKQHNMLFFDTNVTFSSSEELYECYYNKYKDLEKYNKDISNQIYNLSKIAKWKYTYFSKSIKWCKYGFIVAVVIPMIVCFVMWGK